MAIDLDELEKLMKTYTETRDAKDFYEMYMTDRDYAEMYLEEFMVWLKKTVV